MPPLPTVSPAPIKPTLRFLLQHPAHFIALGFGSGLSPIAPGTAGTLFAWVTYDLIILLLHALQFTAQDATMAIIIGLSFFIGIWASRIAATNLRNPDPGCIVWDEVAAFWLILFFIPFTSSFVITLALQGIAFTLFRLFDAVKKGPVRWADEAFAGPGYKGAFGIMFDDIIAALLTLAVLFAIYLLLPSQWVINLIQYY